MPKQRNIEVNVEVMDGKDVQNRMPQVGSRGAFLALTLLGTAGWYVASVSAAEVASPVADRPTFETRVVEVHKSVKSIGVELNAKSVLCSRAG